MVISRKSSESVECTARFLREGKLVILPTDTIYGFSGIVPDANRLIISAKGRDEGKPFIQLLANAEGLSLHTKDKIRPELLALWPGAVTIIVRNIDGGTTAYRCPGDEWLRAVLIKTGTPVYSTSVNRAGEAPLRLIGDIIAQFGGIADLIVDDGDNQDAAASTIVDATGDTYRIIRQGAVSVPESLLGKQ